MTPKEIVQELMVRDEPTFHNARVLKFFTDLDAAGYVIAPKDPTDEMVGKVFCFPIGDRRYNGEVSKETEVVNTDTSIAIYRAMISAALSSGKGEA